MVAAGGSGDRRDVSRTVRFPQQGSAEDSIRIENSEEIVDKIIAAIHASVNQKDSQTTKLIEVAPGKHRLLIGHGGETRRNLESQFNVSIDIPKISQEGPARSQIKIVGQPDDVEQANIRILDIVKDQIGESLQVPRCVHHSISNNGQFFRQLRNEYKVTVDHAGHVPPPKPTRFARPQVNGRASLPLITDDQAGNEDHAWEIIDDNGENLDEGDIPWILRGSPENIAKARVVLDNAIEQARTPQQSSTGYLVLADPRTYRFIVGSGGSQINSIRKQTGCKITVPRDQAKGDAIEIVGSREGVEQAKEIILQVVQNGNHTAIGGRKE